MFIRTLRNYVVDNHGLLFNPDIFNGDFEPSIHRVVQEEFSAIVRACHFHFNQCNIRYIRDHGMQTTFQSDIKFRTIFKMIISLAYLPLNKIDDLFDALRNCNLAGSAIFEQYCDYFQNQWLPKKHLWYLWDRPDSETTNNVVESWHNKFTTAVCISHPNIWKFLSHLQEEENFVRNMLTSIKQHVRS